MSNEKLMAENVKLKERIQELKLLLKRKSSGSSRAYDEIRAMIISKVDKEVEIDNVNGQEKRWTRQKAEKQIMGDLKWDLRIRRVADFRDENIEPAREYIKKYIIPEELKKSRWVGV